MSRYSPQVLPQGTDYTQFTNALFGGLEQAELMRRQAKDPAEKGPQSEEALRTVRGAEERAAA